jgi:hypothetical protein
MTQEESMKTVDDLRKIESAIRDAEAEAQVQLSEARAALETSGRDDRESYAAAVAAGEQPPKEPSTPKLVATIRDIEKRVLPALDDALWRFAQDAREAIRGDVEVVAFRTMRRWNPPHAVNDPSQPAATRHGEHRPRDIVAWVEHKHRLIVQEIARADAAREKDERFSEAKRRVDAAQAAYNADMQRDLNDELDRMSPGVRLQRIQQLDSATALPWRPFDRHEFLKREGLLEDYGYTQPGTAVQVKGGNRQPIEFVPREQLQPTATEA